MPSERVLVVEDHPESAEGLAVLLDIWGYEAHVAHDGGGALALARDVAPEVVVADIGLPGMDGIELARAIRTLVTSNPPFLIALTGRRVEEIAQLGVFDHVLRKPVDVQELERVLHDRSRVLHDRRALASR